RARAIEDVFPELLHSRAVKSDLRPTPGHRDASLARLRHQRFATNWIPDAHVVCLMRAGILFWQFRPRIPQFLLVPPFHEFDCHTRYAAPAPSSERSSDGGAGGSGGVSIGETESMSP